MRLRSILDGRDDCLSAEEIAQLKYAYKSKGTVRKKGVYIWIHLKDSSKVYVGSYYRTSLFKRTHKHLATANSQSLKNIPRWRHLSTDAPRRMYSYLLRAGCGDMVVFPLQLLPDTATDREVLECEQRWIDRFNSMVPNGYNARRAARGVDIDRQWCVGRYYSSRDMCRRIYACYKASVDGRLEGDSALQFFANYRTKTIAKMHTFCARGYQQHGISATDLLGEWRVPVTFCEQLKQWLNDVLTDRFETQPASQPKQPRKLLITTYWSTLFDHINFHSAFTQPEVLESLPTTWRTTPPVVGFKYKQPLGLKFCNHAHVARNLTAADIQHYMDPNTPCMCSRHCYQQFIPEDTGHVVTCSEKVLENLDFPQQLQQLFCCGAKHRPDSLEVCMSAEVREQVLEDLNSALMTYAQKYSRSLPVSYNGDLTTWVSRVMDALRTQLQSDRFADGKIYTNANKPHEPGTQFVPYLTSYDPFIQKLHKDFVVTTADKLNNNYVVVCKKHYVQSLMTDLSSGQFYTRVVVDPAHTRCTDHVVDILLPLVRATVPDMYECTTDDDYRKALSAVPYEAALVKLHKKPYALRFLACSGQNGLKQPAVWLTHLLRGLHPDLVKKWNALLERAGVRWTSEPPWYATKSSQVVDTVRRFNTTCMSAQQFEADGGWHGYDVVRLYTNIDLHDLVVTLTDVLTMAWEQHVGCDVIQVFSDKYISPVWHPSVGVVHHKYGEYTGVRKCGMKNDRLGVDKQKGRFYLFGLQHAIEVVRLLVENSYVRFGPSIFHQTRGIPMGINPAVFMANYYLFHYEYKFIQQMVDIVESQPLHPAGQLWAAELLRCSSLQEVQSPELRDLHSSAARYLLDQFRFTVRFVDDLTSAPNKYLARLLYTDQTVMGGLIKGIYPRQFLSLEATPTDPFNFPTLDVRIITQRKRVRNVDGLFDSIAVSFTQLYDKRREDCYAGIPIVQYQHVSSTVSVHSGYNIMLGQLHRFRTLIMNRGNYVMESAKLVKRMVHRGYKRSIVMRKLRHHLQLFPWTFGDSTYHHLYCDIKSCLHYLDSCTAQVWPTVDDVWDCEHSRPADEVELVEASETEVDKESELEEVSD